MEQCFPEAYSTLSGFFYGYCGTQGAAPTLRAVALPWAGLCVPFRDGKVMLWLSTIDELPFQQVIGGTARR